MVPQHDIHITYSHSVPTQNVFIAGTWTVPGYQPWDKLPMTFNPETNSFEIVLNCQELEDISDYLDDDGYLHHELLDHPDNEIHSSDAQNTTSPTSTTSSLSKRQRIRRFFGRARSSSSASTTSSHSTTNNTHSHEDTAYHHQCKDGGVPLPLTKEYRYQYKFLVDGEWHCDPNKPTVHDGHGHWNHELVAVLMEQFPSASTVGDNETLANRSRSSSIQSITSASVVSSVYSKPLPLPVVEVSELQGESTVEKEQKISAAVPESAGKTSIVAAAVEVAAPVVATQRSAKSRDTYEAILLFEERDDLSDGEGRSKDQYLIGSDDEHDDTLDEKNEHGPEAPGKA
ncbi:hypothetical protein BGZ83_005858 [Gryganskiella cystojenkinii]|nr:hypothetical protein BGZ83_005858 [Gryganskiella cystojenkinii]